MERDHARLPIRLLREGEAVPAGHFLVVWGRKGGGLVGIGRASFPVSAPFVLCLEPREARGLCLPDGLGAQRLAFAPSVVDSSFATRTSVAPAARSRGLAESLERDAFAPFTALPRPGAGILALTPPEARPVADRFAELRRILGEETGSFRPCRARSALLAILHYLGYRRLSPAPAAEPGKAAEVMLYLQAHYTRRVSLAELCSVFATSRNSLCRFFREAAGVTVGEYLEALRMRLATSLLAETALPVEEVAARAGYGDLSHFGRRFKARTGCAPSEYRRRVKPPARPSGPPRGGHPRRGSHPPRRRAR